MSNKLKFPLHKMKGGRKQEKDHTKVNKNVVFYIQQKIINLYFNRNNIDMQNAMQ